MELSHPKVTVHVIVPARNEEDCLGRCLQSLVSQQGISFQITVVDDGSTDRTRAIAESFPGIRVIAAGEPAPGIMGKCNALIKGAAGSTAEWLLFTDADTFHYPSSLAASVKEAQDHKVDLLSYSPEQEIRHWWELMLMPLVFAELTRTYPTERVNDPADPTVAANGQYILVRRTVYEELGGHHSVARKILEDLELARLFKASNYKIRFRYGSGMVRTRMYRTFQAMCDGWTKNLTALFNSPLLLATKQAFEFIAIFGLLALGVVTIIKSHTAQGVGFLALGTSLYLNFIFRIRQAHFPWAANLMAFLGLPLFVSLLIRSYLHSHIRRELTWKGRKYRQSAPNAAGNSSIHKG